MIQEWVTNEALSEGYPRYYKLTWPDRGIWEAYCVVHPHLCFVVRLSQRSRSVSATHERIEDPQWVASLETAPLLTDADAADFELLMAEAALVWDAYYKHKPREEEYF
ncbi:MAG: hypothetical protein KF690_07125 [Bacteroidetes bacterium]|nr:hypothetical protein [Bacteroidota bacterium]